MDEVVDNDDVLEIELLDYTQVLDVKPIMRLQTVIPRQHRLDRPRRLVQILHNRQRITFRSCSIHNDIILFAHIIQKPIAVGSDIELEYILAHFECDIGLDAMTDWVDEGLVEVEDE